MLQRCGTMGTIKEIPYNGGGGKWGRQNRREKMSMTAAETQEDKRMRIGWENVDDVPPGRMETAAPMAPNPFLAE